MSENNVYSNAKVVQNNNLAKKYELNAFVNNNLHKNIEENISANEQNANVDVNISTNIEPLFNEIRNLGTQVAQMNEKLLSLQKDGFKSKDIDKQVVQAIKDLKYYASFFEQASFQMEAKLLKTSFALAQKIINIELGENSSRIAKQTIDHILDKIKTASKIQILLNPKDYEILINELDLKPFIQLKEDINVSKGGVVISSDLGNFDGNINSKVESMLETLDIII